MRYLCKSLIGGLISEFLLSYTKSHLLSLKHQASRTSLAIMGQSKVHQPTSWLA
jgi:hypothetical protein